MADTTHHEDENLRTQELQSKLLSLDQQAVLRNANEGKQTEQIAVLSQKLEIVEAALQKARESTAVLPVVAPPLFAQLPPAPPLPLLEAQAPPSPLPPPPPTSPTPTPPVRGVDFARHGRPWPVDAAAANAGSDKINYDYGEIGSLEERDNVYKRDLDQVVEPTTFIAGYPPCMGGISDNPNDLGQDTVVAVSGVLLPDVAEKARRIDAVRAGIQHAWGGYRDHAWGQDNLLPLSGRGADGGFHHAVTLVDSLDTLWIAGLYGEFDKAVDWAAQNLPSAFDRLGQGVSAFETTIRSVRRPRCAWAFVCFFRGGAAAVPYWGFVVSNRA